jgi:hypothetical protein
MKKLISTILCLIFLSFLGTCLAFVYRYMWFSTETIPSDRAALAGMGLLISAFVWGFYEDTRK